MSELPELFLTCPKGVEALLAAEVVQLGGTALSETVGGIRVAYDQRIAYRLCLWSRLANRVLLVLNNATGTDDETLYSSVQAVDWTDHIAPAGTLAVDFTGRSDAIRDSRFGALRVKDAIVDQFRDAGLERPDVAKAQPDVRVNVRLHRGHLRIAVDLSGESLHRRGYREQGALAPLKENMAAAVLLRADWPGIAARGGALIDPMCGSGTLLIEGAMMAMNIAPQLLRKVWGFDGWQSHVPTLWRDELEKARDIRAQAALRTWPEIRGWDASGKMSAQARSNIERALLHGKINVSRRELAQLSKPTHLPLETGLLITNPPWGERLGEAAELVHLYRNLGTHLREQFIGWHAAVLSANPDLGKRMGLRSIKQYQMYIGKLEAKLLLFEVKREHFVGDRETDRAKQAGKGEAPLKLDDLREDGRMIANRIRKNDKKLASWRKREDVHCYRVYDADIPEFSIAVDNYDGAIHVAEYAAPENIPQSLTEARLLSALEGVSAALEVPLSSIALKQRRRQKGAGQYQQRSKTGRTREVREGQATLLVNLEDYLDTGLFLDHRPVRLDIAARARDAKFLNLFCYTGAATVHAGMAGARFTTSVDTSGTYLDWARKNLSLNGLSPSRHHLEQADCMDWLRACTDTFDLILLDPPTFSNSSSRDADFDLQRDHVELINLAMTRLERGGLLIFSNNKRGFKLDAGIQQQFGVEDKTRWSLPPDFQRPGKPIHQCWYIIK